MYTLKFALATAAAAVVLSAIGAASASAGWWVQGTNLSGSAALASTAKVTEGLKLSTGKEAKIECTGTTLNVSKGEIASPNKLAASSVTFNGCKSAVANCTESPSSLGTLPVLATELTGVSDLAEDKLTIAPTSGTTLATFEFSGGSCAFSGKQAVKGKLAGKLLAIARKADPVAVLAEPKQLTLGSSEAQLTAGAELELATKLPYTWSNNPLLLISSQGTPILNGNLNRWELRFAANEAVEFLLANVTAAAYKLEASAILPNENNFEFVEQFPEPECEDKQELKQGFANACLLEIKNKNAGDATFRAEIEGGMFIQVPLTR